MLPEIIEVVTSTADRNDAEEISSSLVKRRLAACVQISGPVESRYRWNERLENTKEYVVTIKTRGDFFAAVTEAIMELHPYDEPEVLALPILAISEGYRRWLLEQIPETPELTHSQEWLENSEKEEVEGASRAAVEVNATTKAATVLDEDVSE